MTAYIIPKKCDTFGCQNTGVQMYQIAPGTSVWLCAKCIEIIKKEESENS